MRRLRRDPRALLSAGFLLLLGVGVLTGGLLARDPFAQDLFATLKPPLFRSETGGLYLLGTDQLGRDLFARLLYGARVSLLIGVAAVLIAALVGTTLGLLAGYYGGLVDALVTGLTETVLALPFIVLAVAVIGVLGPSLGVVVLTLGLTGWVSFARLVRGRVLELREEEFVLSAVALGGTGARALFKHILPNVFPLVLADATLQLGTLILAEAGLSFLGLGVQPPTPTWGGILSEGQTFVTVAWWLPTFPGLLLLLTTLSVNFLGDAFRDVLDRG